jgi:copper chaperone CopZ
VRSAWSILVAGLAALAACGRPEAQGPERAEPPSRRAASRADAAPPPGAASPENAATTTSEAAPAVDPAKCIEALLRVDGMTCSGCEYNVSSALRLVPGVLEAAADHAAGTARVRFDPALIGVEQLAEVVRTTGYAVPLPAAPPPADAGRPLQR